MYDHVGLRIKNLAASARFYRAALVPLGHVADASGSGFGPDGRPMLWLHEQADAGARGVHLAFAARSEEHTSELQSLMRISYAVFCLKKKQTKYRRVYTKDTN